MTPAVSLRFKDCDPALIDGNCFLSRLVARATDRPVRLVQDSRELVDLQLTSVQVPLSRKIRLDAQRVISRRLPRASKGMDSRWTSSNPRPNGKARHHVWFTGENVRPPSGGWDGFLSYDTDPLNGLNAYLPLWWFNVGLLGEPHSIFTTRMPTWQEMLKARDHAPWRPKFACAFINNPEPMRMHAIQALREVGDVDVFGAAVGRPVPDKASVAKDYRFVLCFENDIYPGYVTEKPFDAWATGAVPLWRGLDPGGYLNPQAMINAAMHPDLTSFTEVVRRVDGSAESWARMASRPILAKEPDLGPVLRLFRRILGGER